MCLTTRTTRSRGSGEPLPPAVRAPVVAGIAMLRCKVVSSTIRGRRSHSHPAAERPASHSRESTTGIGGSLLASRGATRPTSPRLRTSLAGGALQPRQTTAPVADHGRRRSECRADGHPICTRRLCARVQRRLPLESGQSPHGSCRRWPVPSVRRRRRNGRPARCLRGRQGSRSDKCARQVRGGRVRRLPSQGEGSL